MQVFLFEIMSSNVRNVVFNIYPTSRFQIIIFIFIIIALKSQQFNWITTRNFSFLHTENVNVVFNNQSFYFLFLRPKTQTQV